MVALGLAFGLLVGACGDASGGDTSAPGSEASTTTAGTNSTVPGDVTAIDVSSYVPAADDGSADRLQALVDDAFISAVAAEGVQIDRAALTAFVARAVSDWEQVIAATEVDAGSPDTSAEATGGVNAVLAGFSPRSREPGPVVLADGDSVKGMFVFMAALVTITTLQHTGPGDRDRGSAEVGKGHLYFEQKGDQLTVGFTAATTGAVPGVEIIDLKLQFEVTIQGCPDEDGRVPLSFSILAEYTTAVPGGGAVSTRLTIDAKGDATVGDDARVAGSTVDLHATLASQTTSGRAEQRASYVEVDWTSTWPPREGNGISNLEVPRLSSDATPDDAARLLRDAADYEAYLRALALSRAESGWQGGQCIALEVDMPKRIAAGGQTAARATVTHRYENRQLDLPVTATVATGGQSIDPAQASGIPAEFTYTAPGETAARSTVTYSVRSRRGADEKTVEIVTEGGAIDVVFTGTFVYRIPEIGNLVGEVQIGPLTMQQYTGNVAEYVGTWDGVGDVELSLTANIPGCGTATGTQTGGQVKVVGTTEVREGTPVLVLYAEEIAGGAATLDCGAASAIVEGGGISIGAGLINLGQVAIPPEAGTYSFSSSGNAAGLVAYEVVGEAVVTPTP